MSFITPFDATPEAALPTEPPSAPVQTACRTLLEKGISSAPELARGSGDYACSAGASLTGSVPNNSCAACRSEAVTAAQCFTGTDPTQLCELLLAK